MLGSKFVPDDDLNKSKLGGLFSSSACQNDESLESPLDDAIMQFPTGRMSVYGFESFDWWIPRFVSKNIVGVVLISIDP